MSNTGDVNDNRSDRKLSSTGSGIAAGVASTVTTVLTYPLDLIRTRFQVHDGHRTNLPKYSSTFRALHHIFTHEGIRGLYGGITPAIIGASSSWGMYLFGYSYVKREMESQGYHGVPSIISAGVISGFITAAITNPIWVIKTRMQTQIVTAQSNHYTGVYDAASRILKEEGIRAYYKGLTPALAASYHGAVQFLIYEYVCKWGTEYFGSSDLGVTSAIVFVAGGASKIAALFSTQPLSVIKARLQEQRAGDIGDSPKYEGAIDAFTKTLKKEGIRGFYKGVGPAMWRLAIHSAIFFSVMERTKSWLSGIDSLTIVSKT